MATIKSYTDLEQSKKLAEILPTESADMYYFLDPTPAGNIYHIVTPQIDFGVKTKEPEYNKGDIPCWSLAALLEQLPYEVCDDDGNSVYLQINKEDDVYQLLYTDPYGDFESIETDRYEHFVDACVAMIEKLHELNLL